MFLWISQKHRRTSQVALLIKNLLANTGDPRDMSSIPRLGRFPWIGNGTPFQYSCLENSMGKGAWWATVHGTTKSQTWLRNWSAAAEVSSQSEFLIGFHGVGNAACHLAVSLESKAPLSWASVPGNPPPHSIWSGPVIPGRKPSWMESSPDVFSFHHSTFEVVETDPQMAS